MTLSMMADSYFLVIDQRSVDHLYKLHALFTLTNKHVNINRSTVSTSSLHQPK